MKAIERLNKYMEIKKIVPMELEQTSNISNGYIGNQLKKKGSIGSDILEKIATAYPDLNLVWLITGKGPMIVNPPKTTKADEEANHLLEEDQADYKRKTELLNTIKKSAEEVAAIEEAKRKRGRKKKE